MAGKSGREIIAEQPFSWKHLFLRWESMLVLLVVAVNIMNIAISDKYWSVTGLFRATNSFLNIAFMVLAIIGVVIWTQLDDYHTLAAIVLILGVVLKIAEVCIRLFKK